jgi:hypothetical protein
VLILRITEDVVVRDELEGQVAHIPDVGGWVGVCVGGGGCEGEGGWEVSIV